MLGKLMKYELKATARLFLPFYAGTFAFALVNKLFLWINSRSSLLNLVQAVMMLAFVLVLLATIFLTIFVTVQRFYRNFIKDEGYLMFTLPVNTSSLILSKLFTAVLWMLATIAVVLLSILLIPAGLSWYGELVAALPQLSADFYSTFGMSFGLFILEVGALVFISGVSGTLMIYAAISLGNLFHKNKIAGAFLCYIGLYLAMQMINSVGLLILGMGSVEFITSAVMPARFFNVVLLIAGGSSLLEGAGFYFITSYLMGKKLNLE